MILPVIQFWILLRRIQHALPGRVPLWLFRQSLFEMKSWLSVHLFDSGAVLSGKVDAVTGVDLRDEVSGNLLNMPSEHHIVLALLNEGGERHNRMQTASDGDVHIEMVPLSHL